MAEVAPVKPKATHDIHGHLLTCPGSIGKKGPCAAPCPVYRPARDAVEAGFRGASERLDELFASPMATPAEKNRAMLTWRDAFALLRQAGW